MLNLLITLVNILILVGNIGLLAVFIKLYSEVLKIKHIDKIGSRPDHWQGQERRGRIGGINRAIFDPQPKV